MLLGTIILYKAHDVSGESRLPKGAKGAGEWTKGSAPPSVDGKGRPIATKEQIAELKTRGFVVPPTSWGLWISDDPESDCQAKFYDRAGREQRLYSPHHNEEARAHKFGALDHFKEVLPDIRRQVEEDLRLPDAERNRVCAAVVAIIDDTTMRVGSEQYAQDNGTYGASSLRKSHVTIDGNSVRIQFAGKHDQPWNRVIDNPKIVAAVRHMLDLPGERLFQCRAAGSEALTPVKETTIGRYLKRWGVSAKQFRTHRASEMAENILTEAGPPKTEKEADKTIAAMVNVVCKQLGNTPAVCRAEYINPAVIDAYRKGLAPEQGSLDLSKAIVSQEQETRDARFAKYLTWLGKMIAEGKVNDEDEPNGEPVEKAAGSLIPCGDIAKAAKMPSGMGNLFDLPQVHIHIHPPTAPHTPRVPRAVKRAARSDAASGSLFDESLHPRADLDQTNPETGKTIKPGQFAPKHKAEIPGDQADPTDGARRVAWNDDKVADGEFVISDNGNGVSWLCRGETLKFPDIPAFVGHGLVFAVNQVDIDRISKYLPAANRKNIYKLGVRPVGPYTTPEESGRILIKGSADGMDLGYVSYDQPLSDEKINHWTLYRVDGPEEAYETVPNRELLKRVAGAMETEDRLDKIADACGVSMRRLRPVMDDLITRGILSDNRRTWDPSYTRLDDWPEDVFRRHEKPGYKLVLEAERRFYRDKNESVAIVRVGGEQLGVITSGTPDYVEIPPTFMQQSIAYGDCILTHNHPYGWELPYSLEQAKGTSFSSDDVALACACGLVEMRAISRGYLHTIRPDKDPFDPQTWPRARAHLGVIDADISYELAPEVRSGRMSAECAFTRHVHEKWTRLCKKIGWIYERTPIEHVPGLDIENPGERERHMEKALLRASVTHWRKGSAGIDDREFARLADFYRRAAKVPGKRAGGRGTGKKPLAKAIALNRETGQMRGQASAPMAHFGPSSPQSGFHADRLASVGSAIGKTGGVSHVASRYTPNSDGDREYHHSLSSSNDLMGAKNLMRNLSATHSVSGYHTSRAEGGALQHHFTAVAKDYSSTHHFTLTHAPDAVEQLQGINRQSIGAGVKKVASAFNPVRPTPATGAMSGIREAASSVPGMKHTGTSQGRTILGAQLTSYNHNFTSPDAKAHADKLDMHLKSTGHNVTDYRTFRDASGAVNHRFNAYNPATDTNHTFTVKHVPEAEKSPVKPSRPGAAAGRIGGAIKSGLAKLHAPKIKEDPAHTAPIVGAAGMHGMVHHSTGVKAARRNAAGGAADRSYAHWFTHSRPLLSAQNLRSHYMSQGHAVSEVQRSKRFVSAGEGRHQYSFSVTPAGGGPSHHVNVMRGAGTTRKAITIYGPIPDVEWLEKAIDPHDKHTMGIDFGDMAPAPVSHPAGHESNPLPRTEMHPAKLAARVGPSLSEHTFHGQGGWVAHVRRRVASANGTEKSARNTTTYYGPKGRYHQYTEQPNGEHKRTASDMPYDRTRLKEFLGAVAERSGRGMSPKEQQHEYRMRELRGRLRKALRSAIVNTSH